MKRLFPIASVLAVGAIVVTMRTSSATTASPTRADLDDATIGAVEKTLLPAIKNAELKDLVVKVAPAFGAHRDAAKNLLGKQL
jgi:hypothetical protein